MNNVMIVQVYKSSTHTINDAASHPHGPQKPTTALHIQIDAVKYMDTYKYIEICTHERITYQ